MRTSSLKSQKIDDFRSDLIKNNKIQKNQEKTELNPPPNIQSIQNQEKTQEKQQSKKQTNLFEQYVSLLKRKVLKRKIILFILNILLTLVALIFCLFFIIWSNGSQNQQIETKIQEVFSTNFSLITLGCIVLIGVLSAIFSIIIINGKVFLLHCYWISCLLFLIVFSVISASAFSLVNMDCEQPSSYVLQKLKSTNAEASRIFCSDLCPCKLSQSSQNNATKYESVQECPNWNEMIYSSFFYSVEEKLKCSGWCSVNQKSYYTFFSGEQPPMKQNQVSCFHAIQNKIESDTSYFRIFSLILCSILILVIFYTNYYIFMEKQDENTQSKKLKKRILETQQIMEDGLKTSQRMLS